MVAGSWPRCRTEADAGEGEREEGRGRGSARFSRPGSGDRTCVLPMLTTSALSAVSHEQDGHVGHTCLSQAPVHRLLQLRLPPPPAPQGRTGHVSCVTGVCRTWASSPGTRHARNSGNPAAALQNSPPDQTEAPGPACCLPILSRAQTAPAVLFPRGNVLPAATSPSFLADRRMSPPAPARSTFGGPNPATCHQLSRWGPPGEEAPQWEATSALKSSIRWWERVVSPACRDNPGKTVLFF